MPSSEEIKAKWNEMSGLLRADSKLAEILASIDEMGDCGPNDEHRPRLKVPYVTASSITDTTGAWS